MKENCINVRQITNTADDHSTLIFLEPFQDLDIMPLKGLSNLFTWIGSEVFLQTLNLSY